MQLTMESPRGPEASSLTLVLGAEYGALVRDMIPLIPLLKSGTAGLRGLHPESRDGSSERDQVLAHSRSLHCRASICASVVYLHNTLACTDLRLHLNKFAPKGFDVLLLPFFPLMKVTDNSSAKSLCLRTS